MSERIDALESVVQEQAELIRSLRDRLDSIESASVKAVVERPARGRAAKAEVVPTEPVEEGKSRRGFLKLAGVAAAVAAVSNAQPAAAADGGTFTGAETHFISNVSDLTKGAVKGSAGVALSNGVIGDAPSGSTSAGVWGRSSAGYGVYGESATGYSIFSAGRMGINSAFTSGPPSAGTFNPGDIVRDGSPNTDTPNGTLTGSVWVCVAGGTPGKWRKIAGPTAAGSMHLLAGPTRVANSISGVNTTLGPITSSGGGTAQRTVSVANNLSAGEIVPPGATGVIGVVVAFAPGYPTPFAAGGDLVVMQGGALPTGVGLVWNPGPPLVGSTFTAPLNANRQVTIWVNGSCHFVLDISGYFL